MGDWDEIATQIRGFSLDGAERIVVADANRERADWLCGVLGSAFLIERSDQSRRVFERLTADPPRVLVVGTDLVDLSGTVLLAHAARHQLIGRHQGPVVFLLSDSANDAPTVDEEQVPVFYRLTPAMRPDRVRELFDMAFDSNQPAAAARPEDPGRARLIVEHAKRFAVQTGLKNAASAVQQAIAEVCRAERAHVLYFDAVGGSLWIERDGDPDLMSASIGLAGFVARTGRPLALERAADDPAYKAALDDPLGTGTERIALCPVRDRDAKIQAVVIAIRPDSQPAYDPSDLSLLSSIAEAWGPYIHQLALDSEDRAARDAAGGHIFRQEAMSRMFRGGQDGDVVRVNPAWMSGAYWIVLLVLLAAGAFGYFVQVGQYSTGVAVVKVTGRRDVIAYDAGTVTSVEVVNGTLVKAGQVLARLHDTDQAVKFRALETDYERKLVAYILNPSDAAAGQALGQVLSDRETALANVNARVLRAPSDGRITDVRVRAGQRIDAGGVVMSIARPDQQEGLVVLAFLPGADQPRLRANQPMRLSLPGYRGVHFDMEVRAISSEVLGGSEAISRYLGDRFKEALPAKNSVVVVEGRLSSARFESDGETYELHDGMLGNVEVELDSRSLLEAAIPGLGP